MNGRVEVVKVNGLLADHVQANNIDFQIRGIRSYADFDSEFAMGLINRKLSGRETVFLLASPGYVHVSSSFIRELSMYERRLEDFVPSEIEEEVYNYLFAYYKKLGIN